MSNSAVQYLSFNKSLQSSALLAASPESGETVDLPLQYSWTLWQQHKAEDTQSADYKSSMKPLLTVSTAAEFWRAFVHVPQPSHLLLSPSPPFLATSFMLFREGVRPEWEDPLNRTGGHLQFCLSLSDPHRIAKENAQSVLDPLQQAALLDDLFNTLVLGLIGNSLPHAALITGLRLVDKTKHSAPANPSSRTSAGHVRVEIWYSAELHTNEVALADLRRAVHQAISAAPAGQQPQSPLSLRIDARSHSP